MRDQRMTSDEGNSQALPVDQHDTSLWTSAVYSVRFAQIEQLKVKGQETGAFRASSWGISENLAHLLADNSPSELSNAIEGLMITQNHFLGDLLGQMAMDFDLAGTPMPPLEMLFFTVEMELFLSGGLRMNVSFVTNIVTYDAEQNKLEKFVAIVDPAEAERYVIERKRSRLQMHKGMLH